MFKKIFNYFNRIDYSELNEFQRSLVYLSYSGNIRKA